VITLFTDFGVAGPYLGQLRAALQVRAPEVPVIDLMSDVPPCDVMAGAYLLPALAAALPAETVFLCVVDPGVGGARPPVIVWADGQAFVGPGNGLFELVVRRASQARCARIDWRPEVLSSSFHGRDLFAPVAAMLARGGAVASTEVPLADFARPAWPDDLARIIHVDNFGNAISGFRADEISACAKIGFSGHSIAAAETFSAVPKGQAFWYKNSSGLLEIAVNQGRADESLGLAPGARLDIEQGDA
jgi:S-adenosylmethionine hydrolase